MSVVATCVSPLLARALAARLRDAVAAGEQLASFAFSEGAPPPAPELFEGEELAAAHDFLLRVLQGIGDPVNWRVLAAIVESRAGPASDRLNEPARGLGLEQLRRELALPRLAVTERVNGLIQLGLVARDLERDSVTISPAGEAIFELVCELDAEIAQWLSKRRRS